VLVDLPHFRAWREALQELMDTEWADLRGQTSYSSERFTEAVYQEVVAGRPRLAGALAALEYLRFANVALAELWDRKRVSCVQITMAEDFGVEGRGRFYDSVGALRDVVQNHLLQVLALIAMDPPAGASAGDTQDKKAEVLRAMPPADP
jgi:hypothetical protein